MIKAQRIILLSFVFVSIAVAPTFSQIRYGFGVNGGYNISMMTYNVTGAIPDTKPVAKSYNPVIGAYFTATQKEILYVVTGINSYKVNYGFKDLNTKAQTMFTDKCYDLPLNFGLRVAKTKKNKVYFYIQGGITFRLHTVKNVFVREGNSNNNSSFGSKFDSDRTAYTDDYLFTSSMSPKKLAFTFAPNIGLNARINMRSRVKLDYGVSLNYQEITNQVKMEEIATSRKYIFAPNSRTTVFGHVGILYLFE